MDQHAASFEVPKSQPQSHANIKDGAVAHNTSEFWERFYQPYTVQEEMEWLSNNNVQYAFPSQDYVPLLQHPISEPSVPTNEHVSLTPRQEIQADMHRTPSFSSHGFPAAAPQAQAHAPQSYNTLAPGEHHTVDRPLSAGTMIDSGSISTSDPSSNHSSPVNRGHKFKVPAIRTQFENKGQPRALECTPLSDSVQVAPDSDSMSAMSNEWMYMHDNSDQYSITDQSLSSVSFKASPALLGPIQFQSPVTRRTSLSSAVSGPVFSPYGTPVSGIISPYSQHWQHQQNWTPTSMTSQFSASPQSPHRQRPYATWSHSHYNNSMRPNKPARPAANSLPSRNRPRLPRNVTDTYAIMQAGPSAQSKARSYDTRARAKKDSSSLPTSATSQQLPLPEFQLTTLFSTPDISQAEFHGTFDGQSTPKGHMHLSSNTHTPILSHQNTPRTNLTPNFAGCHINTPYAYHQPFPYVPTNVPSNTTNVNPISTPAHQPPLPVPSEPPIADFLTNANAGADSTCTNGHSQPPACGPIRQSPHFEGDIYTPRFKRRNAAGKWEGWCGYCQPGRWLDLKNSRYWEDKLRNHGICARTKTFFEGPTRIRWVSDRGTVWEGAPGDSGFDIDGKEGIDDDGVGRKREGLCGECDTWVGMDGMRSRGKGRCVAWWMHAYKCHEQSKSRNEGNATFEQV